MQIPKHVLSISLSISIVLAVSTASAESLFKTGAQYRTNQPFIPASLFTPPTPKNVGDFVTILVSEKTSLTSDAELKVTRTQTVTENGTGLFNGMVRFFADKLPFGGDKVTNALEAPSFNGLDNNNNFNSKAESSRETELTDTITCQVVQVLPNGMLMVQGKKVNEINRDHQDIYVSGVVNPYFLDRNNRIPSNQVGNLQVVQGGKGVVSRQQGDGVANKIYQFFN